MDLGAFFGATAGGVLQGQQQLAAQREAEQLAQMRQLQIQQAQQSVKDASIGAQMPGLAGYFESQQQLPPPQQPPMPGQASVPMVQPSVGGGMTQPPAGVPLPYQAPQNMPQGAPQQPPIPAPYRAMPQPQEFPAMDQAVPVTLPPKPPSAQPDMYDPATFSRYLAQQASELRAKGASPAYIAEYTKDLRGQFKEASGEQRALEKEQRTERKDAFTAQQAQVANEIAQRRVQLMEERQAATDKRSQQQIDIQLARLDQADKRLALESKRFEALAGVKNMGHFNSFMQRETKDLAPITEAQRKGAEIVALLDSGQSVTTPQVQQALSSLYSQVRMTNHLYADNKSFGNIEQRLVNSINRFASGKYSAEDQQMIRDMVSSMNDKVFAPARNNIISQYKKQAEAFGYDPVLAEISDPYGTPSKTQGGATPTTSTSAPAVGTIEGGYRFKGGDPSNQANWVKQ